MKKTLVYQGKIIKSASFFGLGNSNSALLDFLKRNFSGISFTLRSDFRIPQGINDFSRVLFGCEARQSITEDILFLSPSVRRDSPEFKAAAKRGTILSSDVEFFFEMKDIPVFAVTGSDGKSTTATLSSLMLSKDNKPFPASANIGLPMTSLLESAEVVGTVAELSSFQLMNFSPRVERALITNFTENHLDWHTSIEEYASAKENLIINAKKRIFNLDCDFNRKIMDKYPAYALYSAKVPFDAMLKSYNAENYFSLENGYFSKNGKPFMRCDSLLIKGEHNLSNFLAAAALSSDIADTDDIIRVGTTFAGLNHRARLVCKFNGISFYDSSIDSTPSRTRVTLSAFSEPTVLILGGRGKNLSYAPLLPLPRSVKAVILTGENRKEIKDALLWGGSKSPIYESESFCEAVERAIEVSNAGDSVLLSPASTSFDSFSSYKERGKAFEDIIKKYYTAN